MKRKLDKEKNTKRTVKIKGCLLSVVLKLTKVNKKSTSSRGTFTDASGTCASSSWTEKTIRAKEGALRHDLLDELEGN